MNNHTTWGHPTKRKSKRHGYTFVLMVVAAGGGLLAAHLFTNAIMGANPISINATHYCGKC